MELIEFTESLIKNIAYDTDAVTVKQFDSNEDNTILIQVLVSENDMPRLIGKGGKVISAIRLLVQTSSFLKDNQEVKIEIDSY